MKLSQISSKEIEALKGKCPYCNGQGGYYTGNAETGEGDGYFCECCEGTGQATIEIEKECVCNHTTENHIWRLPSTQEKHPTKNNCGFCNCKKFIPKHKVGDEIIFCGCLILIENSKYSCDCEERDFIKLKIISETEKTWKMVMVT